MTGVVVADLVPVEAGLWAILDPYRDRLVTRSLHGMPTLARPGAKAHDYFAGVRLATAHVALHLMPIYHHPSLLDGVSPALRTCVSGKATLRFRTVDEAVFADLEALVARSFEAYAAAASGL